MAFPWSKSKTPEWKPLGLGPQDLAAAGARDDTKPAKGYLEAYGEIYDDETRKLARDLLLTYIGATGQFLNKVEVQEFVRAARWLMEEWCNPTPDPPPSRLDEQ